MAAFLGPQIYGRPSFLGLFINPTTTNYVTVCSALSASARARENGGFFLFRSVSEGRTADKNPLKKYTAAIERPGIRFEKKGTGFDSRDALHSEAGGSEDMKKKTFLPYKQAI
ncbi:hypothetical protein DH2020_002024 [Rehmannia glutinosa]|uniref:Uncharacterized protein n=1 Tax=Rehmannia glutinosa TaxID=99300 RepID=A0ABR0XSJ2_REHGL